MDLRNWRAALAFVQSQNGRFGTGLWEVAGRAPNQVSGGVAMAGNVLVGGLIGAGMDASSGAMLDSTPIPAFVELEHEGCEDN